MINVYFYTNQRRIIMKKYSLVALLLALCLCAGLLS